MSFKDAYKEFKKAFRSEDSVQDCIVLYLESPATAVSEIIRKVRNKEITNCLRKKRIAPHLYHDDKCIDDNIYFVDANNQEVNETHNVTAEIKEKGIKIVEVIKTTSALWQLTRKRPPMNYVALYNRHRRKSIICSQNFNILAALKDMNINYKKCGDSYAHTMITHDVKMVDVLKRASRQFLDVLYGLYGSKL